MKKNSLPLTAVILLLSIVNYTRIPGHENVRTILVVSLLAIGVLIGVLIVQVFTRIKMRQQS